MTLKEYIALQCIGKRLHFKCDCVISLDVNGYIKDYSISGNEILFTVDCGNDKLITIGENHPSLKVEEC